MKKSILLLIGISFLFFISCKNEKNTQNGNSYVIEANIENGEAYDIDSVYVLLPTNSWKENENTIIARAAYNKGNFKIDLPESLPREKYMQNAASALGLKDSDSIKMSDPTAQMSLFISLYAYKDGKEVGSFLLIPVDSCERPCQVYYYYIYDPFTLVLEESSKLFYRTCNVALQKGWNPMLVMFDVLVEKYSLRIDIASDIPTEFKWVYREN